MMATAVAAAAATPSMIVKTSMISKTSPSKTKKPSGVRSKRKPLVLPPYPIFRNNYENHGTSGTDATTATITTTSGKHDANGFLEGVANLLEGRKNIVVLVGAGISTSVGIPDFRSKDKGLYNTLDAEALGLSCPEDLFCIEFFRSNPLPFYKFAKHLYYPNQEPKPPAPLPPVATTNNGKNRNAKKDQPKTNDQGKKSTKPKQHKATETKEPPAATRTSKRIRIRRQQGNQHVLLPEELGISLYGREDKNEPASQRPPLPPKTNHAARRKAPDKIQADATTTTTTTLAPSDSHKLLALLEKRKMLLRVYTQNIDGLESSAGVSNSKIVYCHGSLRSMSCSRCSRKNLPLDKEVLTSIEAGSVPLCRVPLPPSRNPSVASGNASPVAAATPPRTSKRTKKRPRSVMEDCQPTHREQPDEHRSDEPCTTADGKPCCGGVLKPGITFFGEPLDQSVGRKIESDQSKADALIVIGTSLSVAPISKVVEYLPPNIPRILINRTIVHPRAIAAASPSGPDDDFRNNYVFDAYLLGFCDDITRALGKQLGLGFDVAKTTPNAGRGGGGSSTNNKGASRKPRPKNKDVNSGHASAMGAKLLKEDRGDDDDNDETGAAPWREITVPRDRVLLFPGAIPEAGHAEADDEIPYREVAHCDGCAKEIPYGKRIFKCLECFDYDLCQSCYPRVSRRHCGGKHSFRSE